MRRRRSQFIGIILYLLILSFLLQFDWLKIIQPIPLLSVVMGMGILTFSQYRKGMTKEQILMMAQWNAFFAGLLSSLFSLLSLVSGSSGQDISIYHLSNKLIHLIYGSILYLIIDYVIRHAVKEPANENVKDNHQSDIFDSSMANSILAGKGFSIRECHVALKIMEGVPNKEIAQQLFISESTVKKHIQNIFKKCGATDRQHFLSLYLQWTNDIRLDKK